MSEDDIRFEVRDHVARITLNRPERRNAMTRDMGDRLVSTLRAWRTDPDVRVVVIAGAGETFCAGADLKQRAAAGGTRAEDKSAATVIEADLQDNWWTMAFEKPMIAAVDGYALEAGFELALMCDIRLCTARAQFGLPAVSLGFASGGAGPQRLVRCIPQSMAMEMVLTGDRIDGETALRSGLVSRLCPPDRLLDDALALAARIAGNAPLAVRAAKEMARTSLDQSFEQSMRLAGTLRWAIGQTEDAREGPRSFAEKRKPDYKGN